MDFVQAGPQLANQYSDDRVLCAHLAQTLPRPILDAIEPDLQALGAHAAKAWQTARSREPGEPSLTQWDAWGERIDRVEITPVWRDGAALTTRYGFVAAGHDARFAEFARIDQFARVYLYHVASEFYTCPLAMSDGAATALKASGNRSLIERVLPHLVARELGELWLSGQWMTESRGGSDVNATETTARRGNDGIWRLNGRKWFTSAIVGEMALTLARPEGAGEGTDALALFYVETRTSDGRWNGIRIDRLKDKLGTRELPTAEIHLEDTLAEPVGELAHGVRLIAPVLNVTRTWNAICALATMRRCIALATDYARRREAFGRPLMEQPLHAATLAAMHAEFAAAFELGFFVAGLLGRVECNMASDDERALLRLLTPLAKLWTGKLAVRIASETCEAFGGAGYIENTGIPQMLRDAQVYPIWEGTTNVLALDVLRAMAKTGIDPLRIGIENTLRGMPAHAGAIDAALASAARWFHERSGDRGALEAGARGLALTLARTFAAALLAQSAATAERNGDASWSANLALFLDHGLSRLSNTHAAEAKPTHS
ncbi:MAG TPA: acyl-CoA dehydrogenase family protein [Rhodanobacteraceae bacterium]|jgi:alkylation response protein AidB-like acyl-CoA dehydrogenase|nr:acyl-CoA dehydrogenase family protein [Rhodanobacteraceae bacterium]